MISLPAGVGLSFLALEIGIMAFKRSKAGGAKRVDQGSLRTIWLALAIGIFLAASLPEWIGSGGFELHSAAIALALAVFGCGHALRWWAIATLGRFFTIDVAIHEGHELVQRGPFRWMRHPAYTGVLLAFLGWSITFENAWSIAGLMVPVTAALLYRIHVEEAALAEHFGESWRAYAARVKRLIPGVY